MIEMEKRESGRYRVRVNPRGKRAQLRVFDFSDASHTDESVTFSVFALDAGGHPSTPYSNGRKLYHGESIIEALSCIERFMQQAVAMHGSLRKYI